MCTIYGFICWSIKMVKRLWLHGEREVESTVLPTLEERDIIEKKIYINNLMLP